MQSKLYLHHQATIPTPPEAYQKSYRSEASQRVLNKVLIAARWSLSFLWVAIALRTKVGWELGLLGLGIIILAIEAARKCFAAKWAGFWVVFGVFSFLFGVLLLLNTNLLPILWLLAAAGLLLSGLASRLQNRSGH